MQCISSFGSFSSGASLSVRDEEYHATPVGWAYYCKRYDVFELLIDRAGIHDLVIYGRADRLRAVLAGDPSLANARDDRGKTPLHYLHRDLKHAVDIIDLLVAHGASSRNSRGQAR